MKSARQRRLLGVAMLAALGGLGLAVLYRAILGSSGLFLAPQAVLAETPAPGQNLMVGGWVVPGSFRRAEGDPLAVAFSVSDGVAEVQVRYRGVLPDLFAEGEQAAARGRWHRGGYLDAAEILAKHDENYSPPLGDSGLAGTRPKASAQP